MSNREYDQLSDELESAGLPPLECAEGQSCGSLDAVRTLRQQVVSLTKQRDDLLDERDILQSELNGLVNDLKKIIGIVE